MTLSLRIPPPLWSSAVATPNRTALTAAGASLKYGELQAAVAGAAAVLSHNGVRPGKRVLLEGPPSLDWCMAAHAVAWLGASVVPLSPALPPSERRRRIAQARATLALGSEREEDTGRLPRVALTDLRACTDSQQPPADLKLETEAAAVFTSGSTGAAKLAPITWQQVVFSAMGSAFRLGHHLDDRWLVCLPLWHVGGLSILWRCAFYGTTAVVEPNYEAQKVADQLHRGDFTLLSVVPTMLDRLCDALGTRTVHPQVRAVLVGGAAPSASVLERARALGLPVRCTWGTTETGSQIATHAPEDAATAPLPPLTGVRLTASAEGQLEVTGPIAPDGQWASSDRGMVDTTGRVRVFGRTDHVIISGGENVDPTRVETVLEAHPAVREAAVYGADDPIWGQRVEAALVAENTPVDDATLRAHCCVELQGYEVPKVFRWLDQLPRTPLGKLETTSLKHQPHSLESRPKHVGNWNRFHRCHINKHMGNASCRSSRAVVADQRVRVRNRVIAKPLYTQLHRELVSHANRLAKVGVAMNDRGSPTFAIKNATHVVVPEHSAHHFFVSTVAVLKNTGKEHKRRRVNIVKARRHSVLKHHPSSPKRFRE